MFTETDRDNIRTKIIEVTKREKGVFGYFSAQLPMIFIKD